MFTDKLDPRIFMDVTKYLRRETDYVVWYSVFKILRDTIKLFAYNGGNELLKVKIMILYVQNHKNVFQPIENYNYNLYYKYIYYKTN